MPKASADFRAVRAVLSAPYPLPIVITRNAPPGLAPASTPLPQTPAPGPQPAGSYHGFPVFNLQWRDLPPAIPPVPYPSEEKPSRKWKVKLKRVKTRDNESSDIELLSTVESRHSKELQIIRQLGDVKLQQRQGAPTEISNSKATILSSVFESKLPPDLFWRLSPPQNVPKLPRATLSDSHHQPVEPIYKPSPFSRQLPDLAHAPLPVYRPHALPLSDSLERLSDADSDREDRIQKRSPPSQRVETPVTSRQSHCRRQRPHEPLFIGQTNLAPFTYHVGTRPRATAMDGSFASEASSVKTITRIPRNRHSRGKRRIPVPQKLLYETPAPLSRKGKERAKAPLTPRLAPPTPTGLPHTMSIRNTTSATNMATPTCHHHSTPFVARSAHLNHSFGSANSALSNRASLRRSDPQYIWAPTPLPHVTDGFYGFPHPLQSHEEPFDIPWTPKPMSIDPRSADVQQPSWPRALAHSETVCAHSPTQRTIHEAIPEMFHLSSPSINPKSLIKNASPVPDRTRGFTFALPARSSVELPMAKACHNFLLARRIQASKRRKLLREHQKHLAERFDRPAQVSPMNIDSHPLHLSPPPPQDAPCFAGFRPISSLAQVDETRPPHKRRREESPGSSHLLPTAQIIQIERRDDEADFSTTLRSALDRPTFEAEDREQRRAAWLEAEQRRMASALFVRRGRTRVQREQSRMR